MQHYYDNFFLAFNIGELPWLIVSKRVIIYSVRIGSFLSFQTLPLIPTD